MKKPEKIKVKVGCLALGEQRYYKNEILSGAGITPEVLKELHEGDGTLEAVLVTETIDTPQNKIAENKTDNSASGKIELDVEAKETETDDTGADKEAKTETETETETAPAKPQRGRPPASKKK